MVANKAVPGLTVTVEVNDRKLKEYKDANLEEPEGTVVRYVEAISGHEFSIKLKMRQRFKIKEGDSITCRIKADGQRAKTRVFTPEDAQTGSTYECLGFYGLDKITRARFSELETVSDGRKMQHEDEKVAYLGSLEVKVFATVRKEKAIKGKALSHSVGFGGTTSRRIPDIIELEDLNGGDPIAVFEFRYRSMDALKAELIIPRTLGLEEKNFADLTKAELRELHRQFKEAKALEEAGQGIKREHAGDDPVPVERRVARPALGDTLLQLDEDGSFYEASTQDLPTADQDVIMIDD